MIRTMMCAVAALAAASAAQAQNLENSVQGPVKKIQIVGEAPAACVVAGAPATSGDNAVFASTSTRGAEVAITQFVDPQTAQVRPTQINLALPVICNTGHRVVVRTVRGGLAREGAAVAAQAGFRQLVPYTVSADWAGFTRTGVSSVSGALIIDRAEGAAGDLGIRIEVPQGGEPLIAGAYSDQVIIELQATT